MVKDSDSREDEYWGICFHKAEKRVTSAPKLQMKHKKGGFLDEKDFFCFGHSNVVYHVDCGTAICQ
jgi:hypothetical protein